MSNTPTRSKWHVTAVTARDFFSSMSCKFVAREERMIYFPLRDEWIQTTNQWRLGWSQARRAWVASNGKRGWRFADYAAMREFRLFLESRNWEVSYV